MEQVKAAAPVAPWLGGKSKLANKIIDHIRATPHKTYVEPFAGMGGVFLRKPFAARLEVLNDRNGEIINLFRILQRHYPQLMDVMRFQVASRREFDRLRETEPSTLTDLERAARFLYLQRLAFGGQVRGVFGVAPTSAPRFSLAKLEPILDAAHERLDGVVLENLDWREVLARYDTPATLFYLDPPYWGSEDDYGKAMFARQDFSEMAALLRDIKGRFIMSINDVPAVREMFDGFHIAEARLTYTISNAGTTDARELIISDRANASDLLG